VSAHVTFDFVANDNTVDSQARTVTITVHGVNDAPAITSNGAGDAATIAIAENTQYVTTVTSTDFDTSATSSYSIAGGADATKFHIDAATGALSFVSAPNFEAPTDSGANNVYDVIVQVSDGELIDTQALAIGVTDVAENRAPTDIKLAMNLVDGNSLPGAGALLGTASAADPDAGDTFSYALLAGSSSGFAINATTGALSTLTGLAQNSTYTLDIEARDAANASYHEVFNIITGTSQGGGATGNDTLPIGGGTSAVLAGEDVLYGSGGNDMMFGGAGNDTIFGQNGNDTLYGGAGNDVLSGGNQSDIFKFLVSDGGGVDTVIGLSTTGNLDVLDVSDLLIGYSSPNASQFLRLQQSSDGSGTTLQVDRDGGGLLYSFEDVVFLQGQVGLTLSTLLGNGVIDPTV
jgi:Ca2+-binding RTX toxin-like protein